MGISDVIFLELITVFNLFTPYIYSDRSVHMILRIEFGAYCKITSLSMSCDISNSVFHLTV